MRATLCVCLALSLFWAGCGGTPLKDFRSVEGAFSVQVPGTPEEETKTVNTAIGPIDAHIFTVKTSKAFYVVGYSDYPDKVAEAPADKILDGARDGAVSNVQGKLLSELRITHGGHPGRELKVEPAGGKATLVARIFLAKTRLYQVMVVMPKESSFDASHTAYLDSFKIEKEDQAEKAEPAETEEP